MARPALLALEDGSLFEGSAFGYCSDTVISAVGEVVFNTAMTGYQEILTDPSYADQLITLTYPHIGNVGINTDDQESKQIYAKGLIIRHLSAQASNWRSQTSLAQYLAQQRVLGITDIDTRRLTRLLREKGALKGCITHAPAITPEVIEQALAQARAFKGLQGLDLAKEVTTAQPYRWQEGGVWTGPHAQAADKEKRFHVVAYDFGIKKTILRCLSDLGCTIQVVPAKTPAHEVLAQSPDGIFLSNGPGDPQPCDYAIKAIQTFLEQDVPLFGICLGHQLLALACGAKTVKMKFGHHGGNHPVKVLPDNQVLITSQNHGFTVEENTLPPSLVVTHRSLFDNSIQGIKHRYKNAYGFQGHPEAGPGPNDARLLFKDFLTAMQVRRKKMVEDEVPAPLVEMS